MVSVKDPNPSSKVPTRAVPHSIHINREVPDIPAPGIASDVKLV